MVARITSALVLLFSTLGLATTAGAVDVTGSEATIGWEAASGPVSGYYVIVSRDGGPSQVESVTIASQETLAGAPGESLVVQVAAFDGDGVAGPVSPPSDPIHFVDAGSGDPGDGSGGGDPGDGSGGGDPGDGSGGGSDPGDGGGAGRAVVRDFDADGHSDLIVRTGDALQLWAMHGAQLVAELALPAAPADADLVGTGDYDGNLSADLLWERPLDGQLVLWRMNQGVVVGTHTIALDLPDDEAWQVGGSADFDGDGSDDVMLFSRVTGTLEIWRFDGATLVPHATAAGRGGAWSVTATQDTDGDGLAEIVWLSEQTRTLELQDPATGDFVALGQLLDGWRGEDAVDVDGDGAAELVAHDPQQGWLQAWRLSDASGDAAYDLPSALGLGAYAANGDFDADGRGDLVWADAATGAVTLSLDVAGAPLQAVVDRALPAGASIVSGASGSDDSAFLDRFCSGDLDGDGMVTGDDFRIFRSCYKAKSPGPSCDPADMDSNGTLTSNDFQIFKMRYRGEGCDAR